MSKAASVAAPAAIEAGCSGDLAGGDGILGNLPQDSAISWQGQALRAAFGVALAGALLAFLAQRLQGFDLPAMRAAVGQVQIWAWGGALGLTALAFWAIGQYDAVLHRHFGTGIAPQVARRAGISAIAISQTVGMGVVTGAILRWRMLPDASLWLATRITAAVALSFLAGWAVVTALVWLVAGQGGFAGASWADGAAWAVIAGAGAAMVLAVLRPFASLRWPNLFTIAALVALCAVDTIAAAGALALLMPPEVSIPFATLLPAFLLAYGAGLLSGTPGGVGAFELTLLALLPAQAAEPVLAAVVAWRLVYFVIPAILGAAVAIGGPVRGAAPAGVYKGANSGPDPSADKLARWARGQNWHGPAEVGLLAQGDLALWPCGDAAQMAGLRGHVLVGMLDPLVKIADAANAAPFAPRPFVPAISRAGAAASAITALTQAARDAGRWAAHYKGSAALAAQARAMGWHALRISREAVIAPQAYDLAIPARANLRRKLRRAQGAGVEVACAPAEHLPQVQMGEIASGWAARNGGERGFSMGRYSPDYIAQQRVYLAWRAGQVIAFATFHTQGRSRAGGAEWTLDVMRHIADLPDGTMHALIHAAIEDARAQGAARLSLAAVPEWAFAPPLALRHDPKTRNESPRHPARDPAMRRLWAVLPWLGADAGQGLRQFKDSFAPKWEPRFLCAPHAPGLILAALSIWRAVITAGKSDLARKRPIQPQDIRFALRADFWQGRG